MIWLAQTGHVDPFDFRRAAFVDELHRWFDHYLMGIDNGVQTDPQASIERSPDQWVNYPTWPIPGTMPHHVAPDAGQHGRRRHTRRSAVAGRHDGRVHRRPATPTTTRGRRNPTTTQADRIIYTTPPLTTAATISGTTTVTLTVTPSTSAARLSAVLVDYGTHHDARLRHGQRRGHHDADHRVLLGATAHRRTRPATSTPRRTPTTVNDDVFERGWADLGHYASPDQPAARSRRASRTRSRSP